MVSDSSDVKVKCRKCGLHATAGSFKLDPDEQIMLCPQCIKNKSRPQNILKSEEASKEIAEVGAKVIQEQQGKPVDWDEEDEMLSKISEKEEKKPVIEYTQIPGSDKVTFNCPKCNFPVKYDLVRKTPTRCAYCGVDNPKIN